MRRQAISRLSVQRELGLRVRELRRSLGLTQEQAAVQIVVGWALDDDGQPTPQARHAERLSEALRAVTTLPVILWDESGSTQAHWV